MRIFVIRHGQSEWNKEHRICGIHESDLSEEGQRQAEELAGRISAEREKYAISRIFVSPLRRARETAAPIEKALGIKAEVIPELHERNFGIFEGTDVRDPEFVSKWNEPFYRMEGGESPLDIAVRIYPFLDKVIAENKSNILIVCHGALMRIIDTYFHSRTLEEYKSFTPANCSILEYEVSQ